MHLFISNHRFGANECIFQTLPFWGFEYTPECTQFHKEISRAGEGCGTVTSSKSSFLCEMYFSCKKGRFDFLQWWTDIRFEVYDRSFNIYVTSNINGLRQKTTFHDCFKN